MALKKYHLGTPGWSMKEWKGHFFTNDAEDDDFLHQYSSVFNTVEGNTTFYGTPTPATVDKWGRQSSDDFKFCFKLPQKITHLKKLKDSEQEVASFLELMKSIRNKLGPFLIQFPATFGPSQLNLLEDFLSNLSVDFRYAVEVRHPNFFNHGPHERALNSILQSLGIDRVIFDTRKLFKTKSDDVSVTEARRRKPKIPVRFEAIGSRPVVRYIGVNNTIGNEPYLKEWAIVIADWLKEGKKPYFFAHAPDPYFSPWIARRFHQILADLISLEKLPKWPVKRQNQQLNLF